MSTVDFDIVLTHIGERGRYQLVMYYLLCIPATVPAVFLVFSQVFVSASPDHWCRQPLGGLSLTAEEERSVSVPFREEDGGRRYDSCLMYDVNVTRWLGEQNWTQDGRPLPEPDPSWPKVNCKQGWHYDTTHYDSTLVTELDLVCENKWWPSTSTTLFYVGSLFGNVIFGWIADKWGRRRAFFWILFLEVVISIATAFSPNYLVYTVLRTINGLCFPAIFQIPFIIALEMMGPRYRTFAGMVICIFFAMSIQILALLGYLLRNWFSLSLATSVPLLLLFSYYWIIPESPRWLLSKNRLEEAELIVQKMAKVNGKHIPHNFLHKLKEESMLQLGRTELDETETTATPMDLLHYPNLRLKFFSMAVPWVANAVIYNGLSYNSGNLGISDYLAFFIGGVVEIPSILLTWYSMDRWGRRSFLCLAMLLSGLANLSCMFVPKDKVWITVCLTMIGRFGNTASFAVFYVFVGELLPTVIRSQAMGIGSFIAGIGVLTFPFIVQQGKENRVTPLIILGSLSVLGALSATFLPETLNTHLPQTLEEGELTKATFNIFTRRTPARKGDMNRPTTYQPVNAVPNSITMEETTNEDKVATPLTRVEKSIEQSC